MHPPLQTPAHGGVRDDSGGHTSSGGVARRSTEGISPSAATGPKGKKCGLKSGRAVRGRLRIRPGQWPTDPDRSRLDTGELPGGGTDPRTAISEHGHGQHIG